MYAPRCIAQALLDTAAARGSSLTQPQLHKLLFLAEGHHLAHRGEPLMTRSAQADRFGPVYRSVFRRLAAWGMDPLTGAVCWRGRSPDGATLAFLDAVLAAYLPMTHEQLGRIVRAPDGPWDLARRSGAGTLLSHARMRPYFLSLRARAQRSAWPAAKIATAA